MLTERESKDYKRYREQGLPPEYALSSARYTGADSDYPWLADFAGWSAYDESAEGIVDGLTVKVYTQPDEDSRLGDDDVTGTFSDRHEEGAIRNTIRYHSYGQNGQGYKWYVPGNYFFADWTPTRGASKQAAAEERTAAIKQAMQEDADREYYGVIATVYSEDGDELGEASLWGIDIIDTMPSSYAHLRECAAEMVTEAMHQAKAELSRREEKAGASVMDRLRAAALAPELPTIERVARRAGLA